MRFLDKHVAVIVGDGVGRGLLFCVKEEEKERREKKRKRRLGGELSKERGRGRDQIDLISSIYDLW